MSSRETENEEINEMSSGVITQSILVEQTSSDVDSFEDKSGDITQESVLEVLKLLSPGTAMRTALDDILRARMGALIVVESEGIQKIIDGGFKVNCRFSPQRLVELAKMDGAIVLSNDMKKIIYANTLLIPEGSLKTVETGTRHKAAQRTARQFNTIVVAVSERRNKITLYYGDHNHVLENSSEILRRATETLQILEKQKDIFDDLLTHLNVLEITDLTSTTDVCNVLQRTEIVKRITENVKRYLVELGKEGIIVSMRLKELTKNINMEREMILEDYFGQDKAKVEESFDSMNFDFLLDVSNIARIFFEELHERNIFPKGKRILKKARLLEKDIDMLISHFKTLDKIFEADQDTLAEVLDTKSFTDSLKRNLVSLKEKILEGKRV